jgi:hypothetical protein
MAYSSHEGSSSSPSNTSPSLSQSTNVISSIEDTMNDIRCRQKEIVDGNVVRIFEYSRRRHDKSLPGPNAISHRAKSPSKECRNDRNHRSEVADRTIVVVHAVLSSQKPSVPAQTSRYSALESISERANSTLEVSKQSDETYFQYSSLPTPPPTPRIQRLLTPDFDFWKERRFCDCCHRHRTKALHKCFDL